MMLLSVFSLPVVPTLAILDGRWVVHYMSCLMVFLGSPALRRLRGRTCLVESALFDGLQV